MGTIVVNVGLENTGDRAAFERGLCDEASIRRTEVEGVVDTDAVSLALPQDVVERLGLDTQGTAGVTYADGRKDERPVVGPLTVSVVGRSMHVDAIVLPPFSEVLVGQIVLEFLDLVADSRNRTLQPRIPDYPLLDMKQARDPAQPSASPGDAGAPAFQKQPELQAAIRKVEGRKTSLRCALGYEQQP